MRHRHAIVFAAALLAAPGAWAQTYKCLDAAGKVTYSSAECEQLGLRSAGEVRNRINTAPAQKVPPRPPAASAPPAAAAKAPEATAKEPVRRCFKTAKGTRCNDDPGFLDQTPTDERTKAERKAE